MSRNRRKFISEERLQIIREAEQYKPSTHTPKTNGSMAENKQVVNTLIEDVYANEFIRYGYQLSTEELQELGFLINEKKVCRLMKDGWLNQFKEIQWVYRNIVKRKGVLERLK